MGYEMSALFTSQVLIAIVISVVLGAALTAGLFMYFASRTAGKSIDAARAVGTEMIDAASGSFAHVASKGAEVLQPITDGVREVLHSIADRIKLKQRELNELATEKVSLAQEVERLKNRQIDSTQVDGQLKLALVEITQQNYSFDEHEISRTEGNSILFQGPTRTEFVGLQRATFKSQVGIDLAKLRFAITAGDIVLVHGLRNVQVLGVKDLKCVKLLGEVRLKKMNGEKVAEEEILVNDSRVVECVGKHGEKLLDDVQSHQSIETWAGVTAKFGLGFLQACIGMSGLSVMESEELLENGLDLRELCRTLNSRVAESLERVQAQQQGIDARAISLQREILSMVDQSVV